MHQRAREPLRREGRTEIEALRFVALAALQESELVLGLEVVLPDGRIFNGLRALRKDNTGYCQ